VGRDRELALLDRALDGASTGCGRLLVVQGDAGSGKTRFAGEAAAGADRRGMEVVWPPHHPAAAVDDAVRVAVQAAVAGSPLALILDDVHPDDGALSPVASLELSAVPLLVLLTTEGSTWPAGARHPWREQPLVLVLRPLDGVSVTTLAEQKGVALSLHVLERLHAATGGNPFLVTETLDAIAGAGRHTEADPWPLSERALAWMERRLGALAPAMRAAVDAASVLGEVADPATAARLAGEPRDWARHVPIGTLNGSGRWHFTPPFARDLVYASMTSDRRAELHARASKVLEADGATAPAVLLHRCLAASLGGDARTAEVCLRRLVDLALEPRTYAEDGHAAIGAPYFAREGEYWSIGFGDRAVRMRERAGLVYLAHLLGHPGVETPAIALAGRTRADEGATVDASDGLANERARVRVTRRIRDAIERIAREHPELGAHLARTVRTGTRCSYLADPAVAPRWRVRWSR
jgi:hypothetical protein